MIIIVIILALATGLSIGYDAGKASIKCQTCKICETCATCSCPEIKPQINTVYQDKIIYRQIDCSAEKANMFLRLAQDNIKGYYNEFDKKNYSGCAAKLRQGKEHLTTAIGFYNMANNSYLALAYTRYNQAIQEMLNYCSSTADGTEYNGEAVAEYQKYYKRYLATLNANNTRVVFEK